MKKENNPLISIIIPVFNNERYIKECVNSALNQDYDNIEIIIVNDGSTDDTKNICKKLEEKHTTVTLYNQKNSGVSASRNFGIKKSKGAFIYFLDSDDTIPANCISLLYNALSSTSADVALNYSHKKFIGKPDNSPILEDEDKYDIYTGIEAAKLMLLYRITITSCNRLFKKKIIQEHNIHYNEKVKYGEGFSFVVEYFGYCKKVVIIDEIFYNYRTDNANSAMTKYRPALIVDSLKSQEYIQSLPHLKDSSLKIPKQYALWHTACDCINTVYGTGAKTNYTKKLNSLCRKLSYSAIISDVKIRDKLKAIAYTISPKATAKTINHFRIRKFTKEA